MPFGFRKKSTPPTNVQYNPADRDYITQQPPCQTRSQKNVTPHSHDYTRKHSTDRQTSGGHSNNRTGQSSVNYVIPPINRTTATSNNMARSQTYDNSYLQSSTSGNRQYSTNSQTRVRGRNETYPPPSASKSYPTHHESHQRNEYADKRPAYKAVQNYKGSGSNKEGTAVNFAGTDLAAYTASGLSVEEFLKLQRGVMETHTRYGRDFTAEQNYNGGDAYNCAGMGINPHACAYSTEKQRNQRR
ncbi:hypothetical protein BDQ17DRAFT_1410979 [Cyathus striatus]|nr:hypothetical protein BDQ17DRAFT_1410979 [Cyathus striatus]